MHYDCAIIPEAPSTLPSLSGRVALVTGSTGGIGAAIATRLHEAGAVIALHGFGAAEEVAALRSRLSRAGAPAPWFVHDLSRQGEGGELVRAVREQLGSVDVLVNNAGIQHVAAIEDFTDDAWDAVMSVDLRAPFETTRESLRSMYDAGWGRIVNVCSSLALVGEARKAAYVAAKHGLLGLTKVTALEAAKRGTTCNAVCPGWVLTPMVEAQIAQGSLAIEDAELARVQPLGRYIRPEEIAAAVGFLCGDAAGGITGAAISVDGGGLAV